MEGARVEAIVPILCHVGAIPSGTRGTVRDHCNDGRAWVFFDDYAAGHTFHEPERCIRVVCTHRDDNCPANHNVPAAPERGEQWGEAIAASAEALGLIQSNNVAAVARLIQRHSTPHHAAGAVAATVAPGYVTNGLLLRRDGK